MLSSESLKFMLFLFLVWGMSTHSYFVLPLVGDDEFDGNPLKTSLIRMFRLTLLGDFDLWELEGVDPVVNLNSSTWGDSGGVEQVYEPAEGNPLVHNCLRYFSMVGCLVTAVVMMNMFIGVLSNAYERYSERKVEMFHHYKAKITLRCMLRRRFWLWFISKCGCLHWCQPERKTREYRWDFDSDDDSDDEVLCSRPTIRSEQAQETWENDTLDKLIERQYELLTKTPEELRGPGEKFMWGFWTTIPDDLYTPEDSPIGDTMDEMKSMIEKVQKRLEVIDNKLKA
jgi:hypothetical protein